MRRLARELVRLATECADHGKLALDAPGAYSLNAALATTLFSESRRINEFLDKPNARRGGVEWVLLRTLREVKMTTGRYNDDLIATMLSKVFPITGEALRRWRGREARKWPDQWASRVLTSGD
jgi:hypothetical protein